MTFEEREQYIFQLLEEIKDKVEFVVIGGYAINAYTLPRFSVDCDVVVKDKKSMLKLQRFLESKGFKERAKGVLSAYKGSYLSLASQKPVHTTFDILVESVEDRLTGTIIPANIIFKYSDKKVIFGKSSPMQVKVTVADPEMLFIMKAITARKTDIRDIFMLASTKLTREKIAKISREVPIPATSVDKIIEAVETKGFRDSLQGVYGVIPEEQYEKTKKKLLLIFK